MCTLVWRYKTHYDGEQANNKSLKYTKKTQFTYVTLVGVLVGWENGKIAPKKVFPEFLDIHTLLAVEARQQKIAMIYASLCNFLEFSSSEFSLL